MLCPSLCFWWCPVSSLPLLMTTALGMSGAPWAGLCCSCNCWTWELCLYIIFLNHKWTSSHSCLKTRLSSPFCVTLSWATVSVTRRLKVIQKQIFQILLQALFTSPGLVGSVGEGFLGSNLGHRRNSILKTRLLSPCQPEALFGSKLVDLTFPHFLASSCTEPVACQLTSD